MSISGIRSSQGYSGSSVSSLKRKRQGNRSVYPVINTVSNLTVHTGDDEQKALTSASYPDGVSISVYPSKDSSSGYEVKYWDETGYGETTYIEAKTVDPNYATFLEMLAQAAYCDQNGYTYNASGDFLLAAGGVERNITYDSSNLTSKTDYQAMIQEYMNLLYRTNNYQGYMSFRQYFDYLNKHQK